MKKRIGTGIAAVALAGSALLGSVSPASAKVEICVEYPDGIVVCNDGKIILITTKSML